MNVTNGFEYYQILYIMLQNMLVLVRDTGELEIKKSEAEATINLAIHRLYLKEFLNCIFYKHLCHLLIMFENV